MGELLYEFDEDRARLIFLEEIYYLMRAADGRLGGTLEENERALAAAVVAAVGEAARERITELRAQRRAG